MVPSSHRTAFRRTSRIHPLEENDRRGYTSKTSWQHIQRARPAGAIVYLKESSISWPWHRDVICDPEAGRVVIVPRMAPRTAPGIQGAMLSPPMRACASVVGLGYFWSFSFRSEKHCAWFGSQPAIWPPGFEPDPNSNPPIPIPGPALSGDSNQPFRPPGRPPVAKAFASHT